MSYLVGFGDHSSQVHHKNASIPRELDRQYYSGAQGEQWLQLKDPNSEVSDRSWVAGQDQDHKLTYNRDIRTCAGENNTLHIRKSRLYSF